MGILKRKKKVDKLNVSFHTTSPENPINNFNAWMNYIRRELYLSEQIYKLKYNAENKLVHNWNTNF